MSRFLHSHSAFEAFNVCPKKFELTQTGAPRGPVPDHLQFGIAAHRVMELYLNHCICRGVRSDITIIPAIVDTAVREAGMSLERYDEISLVVTEFLRVYQIDVEHSIAREGGIAFDDELEVVEWTDAIEYGRMKNPSAEKGRVFWRSKLDHTLLYLEDRTLVVQDWKSDIFAPSQSKIDDPSNRFNAQAREYAWAAWRALFPADVVRVEFLFMRHVRFGKVLTRTLEFQKDRILETQELTLSKAQFIETTEEFETKPGDHCANCQFRETSCPLAGAIEITDAGTLMRKWLYERVEQHQRYEQLKDLVARFGFDGILGPLRAVFETEERQVPDMERVWQVLQEYDVEKPWAVMTLSQTDAKNRLDKDVYEELIKRAYDPELGCRFNVHQPAEVLRAIAEAHGIDTTKEGKTKRVNKTAAELAFELAHVARDYQPPAPPLTGDSDTEAVHA